MKNRGNAKGSLAIDSLESYGALVNFHPPTGSFDPLGAWENNYSIWTDRQKGASKGASSYLQLKRTPQDATTILEIKLAVTQGSLATQHTEARIECAADAVSTPVSWSLVSWISDPTGKPLDYSRVEEKAKVKDGAIIRTVGKGTRTSIVTGPWTSNWSLFDAVQRRTPDASATQKLTMLEDLDLTKRNQRIFFRESRTLQVNGKPMRVHGYDQIGDGILPYQYWVDDNRRLMLAISGLKVFTFNPSALAGPKMLPSLPPTEWTTPRNETMSTDPIVTDIRGISRRRFLELTALGAAALSLPAQAATAVGPRRQRPNFLFIIADQQIAGAISACSPELPLRTPNIDRLVAKGTRFSTFRSTNPLCSPSRSAMFTGRMPSENGVVKNGLSIRRDIPNLGQWFGQNGYETVYAGKWHLPEWSPTPSQGFKLVPTTGITGNGHIGDASTSRTCEGYLRNRMGSDPFFLVSSFLQPHDICEWVGRNWDAANQIRFPEVAGSIPSVPANFAYDHREPAKVAKRPRPNWTPEQWGYYLWSYYHHVEMVDAEIGRVLDALEDSGQADNTVIVFVSDHGEGCGHHHNVLKNNPYEEALRVPLIISWPGQVGEGKKDAHLSSGYDLMPTFCDFAGIKPPPRMVGRSLKPWAQGDNAKGGDLVAAELQVTGRIICTREFKFVSFKGDPVEQLFDLANDPGETKNLATDPGHASTVTDYRKLLAEWEGRLESAPHKV